jgi:alanine dehydrogenase
MRIGIPQEVKALEGRVALVPHACADIVAAGHEVWIQAHAGQLSGFSDDDYRAAGCHIAADAAELFAHGELIVKVKEPQHAELTHLKSHHLLFCYLHLAAEPALAKALQDIGLTGVAFETVVDNQGGLPLLAPMSEIAGRLAVQYGCTLLHYPNGGSGVLIGGLAAAPRGRVVVLGCGVAGGNSAQLAAAMGAEVTVFDRVISKLQAARAMGANVTALYPYRDSVAQAVAQADLVVGAVLLPGQKAPMVVDEAMVRNMKPGAVIVDIAVDQGGCVATIKPTTYQNPTYVLHGVTHFAVTNMPGAVPRTASQALSAALLPYVMRLASPGWDSKPDLVAGINVRNGKIVHPGLCHSLGVG